MALITCEGAYGILYKIYCIYTQYFKKVSHQTHGGNFVKS